MYLISKPTSHFLVILQAVPIIPALFPNKLWPLLLLRIDLPRPIVRPLQVWGNVQAYDDPGRLVFDLHSTKHWRPLFPSTMEPLNTVQVWSPPPLSLAPFLFLLPSSLLSFSFHPFSLSLSLISSLTHSTSCIV